MSLRSPEPLACEEAEQWLAGLSSCDDPHAYVVSTLTTPVGTDHRQAARAVAAAAWLAEQQPGAVTHVDDETLVLVARVLREVLALPAWERRWYRPSERAAARSAVERILSALKAGTGPALPTTQTHRASRPQQRA